MDKNSLTHTTWNCKYQGRNEKAIEEYIRNQLKEDKEYEQLTMKELLTRLRVSRQHGTKDKPAQSSRSKEARKVPL